MDTYKQMDPTCTTVGLEDLVHKLALTNWADLLETVFYADLKASSLATRDRTTMFRILGTTNTKTPLFYATPGSSPDWSK